MAAAATGSSQLQVMWPVWAPHDLPRNFKLRWSSVIDAQSDPSLNHVPISLSRRGKGTLKHLRKKTWPLRSVRSLSWDKPIFDPSKPLHKKDNPHISDTEKCRICRSHFLCISRSVLYWTDRLTFREMTLTIRSSSPLESIAELHALPKCWERVGRLMRLLSQPLYLWSKENDFLYTRSIFCCHHLMRSSWGQFFSSRKCFDMQELFQKKEETRHFQGWKNREGWLKIESVQYKQGIPYVRRVRWCLCHLSLLVLLSTPLYSRNGHYAGTNYYVLCDQKLFVYI